jgi:hypothetical protein
LRTNFSEVGGVTLFELIYSSGESKTFFSHLGKELTDLDFNEGIFNG